MAKTRSRKAASGSRRGQWIILAVIAALLAGGWYYRAPAQGYAQAATAYTARVACSCRFVAGRSLEDCAKDKIEGMELVTLVDNEQAKSVTARFPLIADDTAYYREGYGCVLQKWDE